MSTAKGPTAAFVGAADAGVSIFGVLRSSRLSLSIRVYLSFTASLIESSNSCGLLVPAVYCCAGLNISSLDPEAAVAGTLQLLSLGRTATMGLTAAVGAATSGGGEPKSAAAARGG